MPLIPSACSVRTCPNRAVPGSRFCTLHTRNDLKLIDKNRPSAAKRGYNGRWQKARKAYLAEHPLCVACKKNGVIKPAALVDHIVPHRGNYELFWRKTTGNRYAPLATTQKYGGRGEVNRWGLILGDRLPSLKNAMSDENQWQITVSRLF